MRLRANSPFAGLVSALIVISSPAFAWDPWGDVTNPDRIITNTGREGERIINQGRTDLSNGLDRIDPRITQIGRDIDRWRLELGAVTGSYALEQWFIASRNSAINGAMPVPLQIRQQMHGWYDDALLNSVWYKVGDGGALNLANNSIRVGHAKGVTLIDVIIFKGPMEANDPSLWVHELKHAQQFRSWGVHDFAIQYLRSYNTVENEAYAVERQFAAQMQQSQYPQQGYQSLPQSYRAPGHR